MAAGTHHYPIKPTKQEPAPTADISASRGCECHSACVLRAALHRPLRQSKACAFRPMRQRDPWLRHDRCVANPPADGVGAGVLSAVKSSRRTAYSCPICSRNAGLVWPTSIRCPSGSRM
jgi:hypothetical protein